MVYASSHDRNNRKQKNAKPVRNASPVPTPTPPMSGAGLKYNGVPTQQTREQLRKRQTEPSAQDDFIEPDLYQTQYGINHSPEIKGSQKTKPQPLEGDRDLSDYDSDTDNSDEDFHNKNIASGDRIADFDPGTQGIVRVDQLLTTLTNDIRSFIDAVKALKREVDANGPEVQHHTDQMLVITEQAIYPWLQEVDSHLDDILKSSVGKNNENDQQAI